MHTAKNIRRISTDILRRVFRILTEPVPHTFVSCHCNVGPRATSFRRFIRIQTYTEPVPLKCGKLACTTIREYTDIFYSVQGAAVPTVRSLPTVNYDGGGSDICGCRRRPYATINLPCDRH